MIRNLLKVLFFPLLGRIRPTPAAPAKPPRDPAMANRLHIFHGTFTTELEATDYCLCAPGRNQPEPLTRDLPGATIDVNEVEIIFGAARIKGALSMLTSDPDALQRTIGDDNTLILIAEAAFFGLPYTLNDTPCLRYAGAFDAT